MKNKLVKIVFITALLTTCSNANENANSDGFYVGIDTSFINIGDDNLNITTYNSSGDEKSEKKAKDITSIAYAYAIGYQHYNKNRVEIFIKDNKINTNTGDILTVTLGVNYEWGFSSYENNNITPYILGGFGVGRTKLKNFEEPNKELDTFGINLGFGIRYSISKNIDAKLGYIHSNTAFGNFDKEKEDIIAIAQDKVAFGITYRF